MSGHEMKGFVVVSVRFGQALLIIGRNMREILQPVNKI
jgi:hypothetical protein